MKNQDMFLLQISARIEQRGDGYGGLRIEENIEIKASDFIEMAKILGQFHDLAQKVKNENL